MNIKKLAIAGIFLISPYVISNYLVFVFLVPALYMLYTGTGIKNIHLVLFVFFLACAVLFPVAAYDASAYVLGILIVTVFVSTFLIGSAKLITRFKDTAFSTFIPCVIWTLLLYLLNFRSLAVSAFDVGILFPISAPLIWVTGSIGLTTLIILFNSAAARYLAKRDGFSLTIAVLLLSVFLVSYLYSITRSPEHLYASEGSRKIALIQGDVPRKSIFGYTERLTERINKYVNISEKAVKQKADLVVWPEFTLPVDVMNRFPEKMKPITDEIKKSGTGFVIGSMLTDPDNKEYNYNTALIFGRDGAIEDIYYSQEPAIFNRGIRSRENNGKLYLGKAGITLCWEETSERIFRNYVLDGAEYFISLSSNTDLDYSWFKRYASFFSRARAAESMRYLARTTQTGVTQIIDPFGRVIEKIPSGRSAFLVGRITYLSEKTFYSKYGDVFVKVFILFAVIAVFIEELKRFRSKLAVAKTD